MVPAAARRLATVLLAGGLAAAAAHPFYVTVCRIDHNPDTDALEITFTFFSDDLERALTEAAGTPVRVGQRETPDADARLFDYLQRRFSLRLGDEPATLRFVGKEVEIDPTWCYVEVLGVADLDTLHVDMRVFYELFDTQTNIVHVRARGQEKSLLLRAGDPPGVLTF